MKNRIILVLMGISLVLVSFVFVNQSDIEISSKPIGRPVSQSIFEQTPPYPIKYWIKKLRRPLITGENLVFKVQYESDFTLPDKIEIYNAEKIELLLRDDGVAPDNVAGDLIYSCYKNEDITALMTLIAQQESYIATNGGVMHFNGHTGTLVPSSDYKSFDTKKFNEYSDMEISDLLIESLDCDPTLKKEKSLYITDIAVVEDEFRTYNPYGSGSGNPNGVWTFGTIMANIENGTHSDGLRGFLKDWVKTWTMNQSVNSQTIESRDSVVETMIAPWLQKANNNSSLNVTSNNWESIWDTTNATNLRTVSPFKLIAIVNRIDLRGNSAYSSTISNAGETRFIFTLINPITGKIPINPNQTASQQIDGIGFVDWRGMNVIFEFGNVQTTNCTLKDLAQQWFDLSDPSYSFGTPSVDNTYKQALQDITDLVTSVNSAPSKTNGSAINRIRTNEKLFATFDTVFTSEEAWELQDWEFRQFELDVTTSKLKMVPLTNNPPVTANYAPNIEEDYSSISPPITNHQVIDWIYSGHKFQVKHGNFNLPTNLLAGSGIVRREETQYFDLDPIYLVSKDASYNATTPSLEAKTIRQQLSLNTCVGCHNGETKTRFTHILPIKYGQPAVYWTNTPDGSAGRQDDNLYPWGGTNQLQTGGKNKGTTYDLLLGSVLNFDVSTEIHNQDFFQHVSAFLTGRRRTEYNDPNSGTDGWFDDEYDDANNDPGNFELPDSGLDGLFYVNDPSNRSDYGDFPFLMDQKWGYNDLARRKQSLCSFLNSNCSGLTFNALRLMAVISEVPLPLGAH